MGKGGYTGGSTLIGPGSSWFSYGQKSKEEKEEEASPKPRNIFRLDAKGRMAERAYMQKLAEERQAAGLAEVKKVARPSGKRKKSRRTPGAKIRK